MHDDSPGGISAEDPLDISIQAPQPLDGIDISAVETWLRALIGELAADIDSVGVRLTDDEEVRRFNRQHRGKDRATDVLSFPGGESAEGFHLGDIVVSVVTARRQAHEAGWPLEKELKTLLLHGTLHCMGYDHETDRGEMEEREAHLRRQWIDHDE